MVGFLVCVELLFWETYEHDHLGSIRQTTSSKRDQTIGVRIPDFLRDLDDIGVESMRFHTAPDSNHGVFSQPSVDGCVQAGQVIRVLTQGLGYQYRPE